MAGIGASVLLIVGGGFLLGSSAAHISVLSSVKDNLVTPTNPASLKQRVDNVYMYDVVLLIFGIFLVIFGIISLVLVVKDRKRR